MAKTTKKTETKKTVKKTEKKEVFKGWEMVGDLHRCPNCGAMKTERQLRANYNRCPVCGCAAEEA